MIRTLLSATVLSAVAASAFAQSFNDKIAQDLGSKGFSRIEIKNGPGQTKVEAVRGSDKVEVVYDNATGSIVKQEWEPVGADDDTAPGLEVRRERRDFVEVGEARDDKSFGRDDDDDDRRGRGRGRGGRDDDDDDRGGRGGDDRRGDDRGGRGGDDGRDHDRGGRGGDDGRDRDRGGRDDHGGHGGRGGDDGDDDHDDD